VQLEGLGKAGTADPAFVSQLNRAAPQTWRCCSSHAPRKGAPPPRSQSRSQAGVFCAHNPCAYIVTVLSMVFCAWRDGACCVKSLRGGKPLPFHSPAQRRWTHGLAARSVVPLPLPEHTYWLCVQGWG